MPSNEPNGCKDKRKSLVITALLVAVRVCERSRHDVVAISESRLRGNSDANSKRI